MPYAKGCAKRGSKTMGTNDQWWYTQTLQNAMGAFNVNYQWAQPQAQPQNYSQCVRHNVYYTQRCEMCWNEATPQATVPVKEPDEIRWLKRRVGEITSWRCGKNHHDWAPDSMTCKKCNVTQGQLPGGE
jgi:hypothetical protein